MAGGSRRLSRIPLGSGHAMIAAIRIQPHATAAALCALLAGACGPPCDRDVLGCEDGGDFDFAADCELEGSLEIALGQGETEYQALEPLEEPTVYEGAQGGRHMFLALAVSNPAPDYPRLQVLLEAGLNDPERCDQSDCDPWASTGRRELVLEPDFPEAEDEPMTQAGLLLVLSLWSTEYERRVTLEIVDQCRREGAVEHIIPPSSP